LLQINIQFFRQSRTALNIAPKKKSLPEEQKPHENTQAPLHLFVYIFLFEL
jgi:hypothetical protein